MLACKKKTRGLWPLMVCLFLAWNHSFAVEQTLTATAYDVELPIECCQADSIVSTDWMFGGDWFDPYRLGFRGTAHCLNLADSSQLRWWGNARSLFSNDLRLEFTGQEAWFGVESQWLANVINEHEGFLTGLTAELYLNQPFDKNLLTDYPLRESYSHNFDVDAFEISQLFVTLERPSWALDVGKFVTPFGRLHDPLLANGRADNHFIRTEAILFRETGLQWRSSAGIWRMAAAITNGSGGRDTNSSKALIARVGIESPGIAAGASVKWQDGVGSEGQKEYKNHAGIDLSFPCRKWFFSTEWIYDQYGLRRPGIPLDEIDWGRSIYNRQLNNGLNNPLSGWGWYANATCQTVSGTLVFGYGQFHPNPIGDPIHDSITRRLLAKWIRPINRQVDFFAAGVFENEIANAQGGRDRKGVYILSGLQFNF